MRGRSVDRQETGKTPSGQAIFGDAAGESPSDAPRSGAHALWYVAPGRADLRPATLPAIASGEVRIRTLWSGVSRGTERLVAAGRVPEGEWERMRAPLQVGDFPFPVKYGYCAVGVVDEGPDHLLGQTVFALHPHQNMFTAPVDLVAPVPSGVPARRAILAANMETALNALWDSAVGPSDRVIVVGGGLVGMLVASLAARIPGADVTVVDIDPARAPVAQALGCGFALPDEAPGEADVVFHVSANAAGLACALACAGQEATVVEMSWYGDQDVAAPLGGAFHSRRLRLLSSQVGAVSPGRRPRWTHARRLGAALKLLSDPRLDALITEEVAFRDLPAALPRILAAGAPGLATAVRY